MGRFRADHYIARMKVFGVVCPLLCGPRMFKIVAALSSRYLKSV